MRSFGLLASGFNSQTAFGLQFTFAIAYVNCLLIKGGKDGLGNGESDGKIDQT
jgi:hypothetical protein